MRSQQLLKDASVCQDASALSDPEVQTYDQVRAHEHGDCPPLGRCNSSNLIGPNLRNCIPRMAQDVARFAAKSGGSVEAEMADFRQAPVFSRLGFIDPYDNPDPDATIIDKDEICAMVAAWATTILNGRVPTLDEQVRLAHCREHDDFTTGCSACGIARTVAQDGTTVVFHHGIPQRVPRDRCRCPILRIGDSCPVHGG